MFASRCVGGVRVPAVVFYIVVVIVIFAYGYFVRKTGRRDVLEDAVIDSPSVQNCDGWALTHFFFWTFMGFWYPGHYVQALGVSLAWEGFEDFLGRTDLRIGDKRVQLVGGTDGDTHEASDKEMVWYGRYTTDTAYNLIGYIIGSALGGRLWPEDGCGCARCQRPGPATA